MPPSVWIAQPLQRAEDISLGFESHGLIWKGGVELSGISFSCALFLPDSCGLQDSQLSQWVPVLDPLVQCMTWSAILVSLELFVWSYAWCSWLDVYSDRWMDGSMASDWMDRDPMLNKTIDGHQMEQANYRFCKYDSFGGWIDKTLWKSDLNWWHQWKVVASNRL